MSYAINNVWRVYHSLQSFVETRMWKSHEEYMDEQNFNKNIRLNNYITISGINRNGDSSTIVLTPENSNIPNHKKDFTRMMSKINTKEIIIVSNKLLTNKMRECAAEYPNEIYSYTFDKFYINMTKAPLSYKHEIMTKEAANTLLDDMKIRSKDIPLIYDDDTQAIWIGARPGDLVKITRYSEATGLSINYRICIASLAS